MRNKIKYAAILLLVTLFPISSYADGGTDNAYSSYSKFGIGSLNPQGTSYSRSMGGVGAATRNHKFINTMNPAAVTARDSLAFMADFGLRENNVFFKQGDISTVNNTFNLYNFVMSFPIWRSSAFMIGLNPYSSVGYEFSNSITDPSIIGKTGNITDVYNGSGSLYEAYIGAGVTFWDRLSVGAQLIYMFGNIEKSQDMLFSSANYKSICSGTSMYLRGVTGKFGVQYEHPFSARKSIVAGATFRIGNKLSGDAKNFVYSLQSSISDTLKNSSVSLGTVKMANEFSIGVAYHNKDKFSAEINYSRSDWTKSNMDKTEGFMTGAFSTTVSQSVNAGIEFIPNYNDIRYYFRRCSYRFGAYYKTDYFKFSGSNVTSYGLTMGATLPVFSWYNGISLGMEIGQRGSLKDNMIRERYLNFTVAFNIFDIWFRKTQYE